MFKRITISIILLFSLINSNIYLHSIDLKKPIGNVLLSVGLLGLAHKLVFGKLTEDPKEYKQSGTVCKTQGCTKHALCDNCQAVMVTNKSLNKYLLPLSIISTSVGAYCLRNEFKASFNNLLHDIYLSIV